MRYWSLAQLIVTTAMKTKKLLSNNLFQGIFLYASSVFRSLKIDDFLFASNNHFLSGFFIFIFCAHFLISEEIALFSPPPQWECAPSKEMSQQIRIGFIGSGKNKFFRPSITLAIEDAGLSLKEYVHAVKKIHQADPLMQIRDLGESFCKIGPAHLLEASTKTAYGEVAILQFFTVHKGTAYVLTASLLQEELTSFYERLLASFHSLNVVPEITAPLSQEEKVLLEQKILQLQTGVKKDPKKAKKAFADFLLQTYKDLGAYWQFLVLKKSFEEIE